MKRSTRLILITAIVVIVVGIAFYPMVRRKIVSARNSSPAATQTEAAKPAASKKQNKLNVEVEVAQPRSMTDRSIRTGNIIPSEDVDLTFETSGKIVEISFLEGQSVQKGQLLAKINDRPLQAQLRKLKAQLPLAEDRLYRQQTLLEKNAVSQESYESVATELEKLKADIELMEANIAQTELHAPFAGVVGLRQVSEGAYVTPQSKVARLSKLSPLKIEFSVPESYAGEVHKGTNITFSMEDSRGRMSEHRAEVYAVESKIDHDTRTLTARALYNNNTGEMLAGRFVTVTIDRREIKDAMSVPSESIIPEMGRNIVYLYRAGRALPVEVETGIRTESRVQILNGIGTGDTVIVTGVMQLRTGSEVAIDKFQDK